MKLEFDTARYIENLRKDKNNYFHTFINRETLAAGVLVLQPGEEDTQTPHESDEMYYILKGDGYLKINKKDYPVSEGKAFFVQKDIEHYFFGNKKELIVLYFFGGPDS
ncbi:MAG: cupin domain-containing protein [Nitrosopumilaceae archaeon]